MQGLAILNAAAIALLLAAGAMPALAGPVQTDALGSTDEVGAPPTTATSPAGLTIAAPDGAPAPAGASPEVAPRTATGEREADDLAQRGAALAAELLGEAGVTQPPSGAPSALRQLEKDLNPSSAGATQSRPSREALADDAAFAEVRDFGKAALQWAKGSLPWLSDGAEDEPASMPTEINWADGPSREAGAAIKLIVEAGQSQPGSRADGTTPSDTKAAVPAGNLVRDSIRAAQKVLSHPMTWLVVSLLVIGGIAMSLADRRPK